MAISLALVALMVSCLTAAPSEPLFGVVALFPLACGAVLPHVFRPVVPRGALYIALIAPSLALLGASALGESLYDNRASLSVLVAVSLFVGLTALAGAVGLLRYVDIQFANAPSVAADVDQPVVDVVSCLVPFDLVSRDVLGRMTELGPVDLNLALRRMEDNGLIRRMGGGLTAREFRPVALTRHGRALLTDAAGPLRTRTTG